MKAKMDKEDRIDRIIEAVIEYGNDNIKISGIPRSACENVEAYIDDKESYRDYAQLKDWITQEILVVISDEKLKREVKEALVEMKEKKSEAIINERKMR